MLKSMILPLFLMFACTQSLKFLPTSNTTYYSSVANASWYFCGASYCSPSNIKNWHVSITAALYPNVEQIYVFTNSTGDNLGFSAYDPNTDSIFLVFRGSYNIQNWIENLAVIRVSYPFCSGCQVHAGFYAAYNDIRANVVSTMTFMRQRYPNSQIIVTGHSLGAALATLAYVDLYTLFGTVDYLYTFGSPRVGDSNFAKYVNEQLDQGFKARITHYKDLIVHLPSYFLGFTHIDQEIFYNEHSFSYANCKTKEEDPYCANQFSILLSVSDHQNYMGFNKETMIC